MVEPLLEVLEDRTAAVDAACGGGEAAEGGGEAPVQLDVVQALLGIAATAEGGALRRRCRDPAPGSPGRGQGGP